MKLLPDIHDDKTYLDTQIAITFAKRRANSRSEGKTLYEICKEMYLKGKNYQVYPAYLIYGTGNDEDDEICAVCNRLAIEFGLGDEEFNPDLHEDQANWNVEIALFRL